MDNDVHTCNNDCQRPACVAVREAVLAERESCAKVCEELLADTRYEIMPQEARVSFLKARDAIRARGDK